MYDLLAGRQWRPRAADGGLAFSADFGQSEGRIYLVTERLGAGAGHCAG